jgi:hypothetical protein
MNQLSTQHPNNTDHYRAALLRGAIAGAVHALLAWLLEH